MRVEKEINELKKKVKFLREDVDSILKVFRNARKVWRRLMKRDGENDRD